MVHLNTNPHLAIASSDLIFAKTTSTQSTALSTSAATTPADSFGPQLAAAIEGYLAKSGNGSQFEIDIQQGQAQTTGGASQFTVMVTDVSGTSATSTASTSPATASGTTNAATTTATTASTTAATTAAATEAATPAATVPIASPFAITVPPAAELANMTPDDAYWAEQPVAVQALRDMPPDQVGQAAMALAKQGYTIDVPIMVWHWDPLTTMVERQNYGYTLVPSGLTVAGPGSAGSLVSRPGELRPEQSAPGIDPGHDRLCGRHEYAEYVHRSGPDRCLDDAFRKLINQAFSVR